jgi:hypothetical protein
MQLIALSFIGHIFEHLSMHGLDPRKEGIMRFNLTIKESAFAWLCQAMGVHPSFIESLNYMVGQYAVFTHYSEDEQTPEVLRKFFRRYVIASSHSLRYPGEGFACIASRSCILFAV